MQASRVMSCRTDDLSLSDKCSRESRDAVVGFSGIAARAIESCQHKEANRQPGTQRADRDSRSRMMLEKPIAPFQPAARAPHAERLEAYTPSQ